MAGVFRTFILNLSLANLFLWLLFACFRLYDDEFVGVSLLIGMPLVLLLAYVCEKCFSNGEMTFRFLRAVVVITSLYVFLTCLAFGPYFYLYFYDETYFHIPLSWILGAVLGRYLKNK